MIKKLLSLLVLLLFSVAANALGLSGIKVNSALNEPLDARIGLISVDAAEIDDVRVKLASAVVFQRTGIERPFLLSKLRFKVIAPEQGAPYIQVTTRESVREPFLDFLIEVSWAGGSMIREFTVLLDPPSYTPPRAEPVVTAKKPSSPPQPQVKQQAASTYGPIRSNETLWVIAGKVNSDQGISRNQTMIALQKSNPDAFQNGNINLLKKGAVLSVPSAEEISSVSNADARKIVKQHMADWREQHSRTAAPRTEAAKPVETTELATQSAAVETKPEMAVEAVQKASEEAATAPAQLSQEAEANAETATAELPTEGQRLRVVDADRNWGLSDKSELGYPTQESDKLREAIKDSEQELAAVQDISQDIVELRAALESKVQALKKALDEKDAQLESLRKQIEQVGLSEGSGSSNVSTSGAAMPAPSAVTAPAGNVAAATPISESRPLAFYWKDQYWMILMGIIIVILASMLLFGRRKRENEGAFEAPDLFQMSSEQVLIGDTKEVSEPVAMIDELFEAPIESRKVAPRETAAETSMFPDQSPDIASILTEADIYLAYRRYTQAETLVEEAMTLNPDSSELKAKLLEIYAFRRDKKAFSRYLNQVYSVLMIQSPELWEKIVEMGHDLVPDHPAWGDSDKPHSSSPDRVDEELDDSLASDDPLDMDMDMNLDINLDELEVPDVTSGLSVFDDLEEGGAESDDDISAINFDYDDPEDPLKDK